MVDNRKSDGRGCPNKSGLAQLAGIKISKRDKIAWWAVLGAVIVLIAGFALRD